MSVIAAHKQRSNRRRHLPAVPAATQQPIRPPQPHWSPLVIRLAVAADETELRQLAHMDSARPLSGQLLLAEQGGSILAAVSLADGEAIADPWVASAGTVSLLRLRAAQLGEETGVAA
jgi:hypothetical protein